MVLLRGTNKLLGYGIRHTVTGRWYAGGGRWRSKHADCRDTKCWWDYDNNDLWRSPEEALKSLGRHFRRTEIALMEAVPLYETPPEDFEEVIDVWSHPYQRPAGKAIPLG